ncbi:MAG: hypothetical protein JNM77_12650 [Pseudonocardia sp.]|nr:hypothetical protein [Pseudonocardia sp.]
MKRKASAPGPGAVVLADGTAVVWADERLGQAMLATGPGAPVDVAEVVARLVAGARRVRGRWLLPVETVDVELLLDVAPDGTHAVLLDVDP